MKKDIRMPYAEPQQRKTYQKLYHRRRREIQKAGRQKLQEARAAALELQEAVQALLELARRD